MKQSYFAKVRFATSLLKLIGVIFPSTDGWHRDRHLPFVHTSGRSDGCFAHRRLRTAQGHRCARRANKRWPGDWRCCSTGNSSNSIKILGFFLLIQTDNLTTCDFHLSQQVLFKKSWQWLYAGCRIHALKARSLGFHSKKRSILDEFLLIWLINGVKTCYNCSPVSILFVF